MWVGVRSYASALAYMMSLFGGVVADSFLGKYRVRTTHAVAVVVDVAVDVDVAVAVVMVVVVHVDVAVAVAVAVNRVAANAACTQTILYCTIVYCIGSATLAITSGPELAWGAFVALSLISVGTGGIKPCVATFGADQYSWPGRGTIPKARFEAELASYFMVFYFGINVGAMGSQVLTPLLRHYVGCVALRAVPVAVCLWLCGCVITVACVVAPGTQQRLVCRHAYWRCQASCCGVDGISTTTSPQRAASW